MTNKIALRVNQNNNNKIKYYVPHFIIHQSFF